MKDKSLQKQWIYITILFWFFIIINIPGWAMTVSSPFGWRIHPVTGKRHFHTGIDIPANYGTKIIALFDGDVVWAETHQGYGSTVLLRHAQHCFTLYGHCTKIFVKPGQRVKSGQLIATVGSTGVSTGPHLHLEYWVNNQYIDPMQIWESPKKPIKNLKTEE